MLLKTIYCRTIQMAFRALLPILPYRTPQILHACQDLDTVLVKEHLEKILIVTDPGILQHGLLEPVLQVLDRSDTEYCIYGKTMPNPSVAQVEDALLIYQKEKCQGLIAVGGGSAMDLAKAVGARVAYPKRSVGQMKGILRILRPIPTLIAVPTTAGTGSETTLAAVITDPDLHDKYALMSFPLIPHYALLDPNMTATLPPLMTAATGMDALCHAIEAYIGRSSTRETRKLALQAVRLIFANLEECCIHPQNLDARRNMLEAAHQAGIAFSKSYVGYIHAIAHALGGQYGTPHGLANAVIMPYVLEAYGSKVHQKLKEIGIAAGICKEDEPAEECTHQLIQAIQDLNAHLNLPSILDDILAQDIPVLAAHAEKEANPLYPVPVLMDQPQLEQICRKVAGMPALLMETQPSLTPDASARHHVRHA